LKLFLIQSKKFHQLESAIQENSGNITIIDGKLVNLVTISSIWLLTQSIKNAGKLFIRLLLSFITSLNSQLANAFTSISAIKEISTVSLLFSLPQRLIKGFVSRTLLSHLLISLKVSTSSDNVSSDLVSL
jgi:hypothetical protein